MGGFTQFELNVFKFQSTHFSQLHISMDPDELESYTFFSSITEITRFAKVLCRGCVPKYTSNNYAYYNSICFCIAKSA